MIPAIVQKSYKALFPLRSFKKKIHIDINKIENCADKRLKAMGGIL